jgi:transposase
MKSKQKMQDYYVGIDISKLTIDVSIINETGFLQYQCFKNEGAGFKELDKWLRKVNGFSYQTTVICMEHTGIYTRQLVNYLLMKQARIWMESALQMKRSMGMVRGKSDKVDSYRIARYAMTHKDQMKLISLTNKTLQFLKDLLNSRNRIIKAYLAIKKNIKEMQRIDKKSAVELIALNKSALIGLKKSQKQVEERMMQLINDDPDMKNLFNLVTSIRGVGKVLTIQLMIHTQLFTKFENAKQLSCYCGVAPFSHTSGTSIKGRIGTSNFANMDIKKTLHMASMSSAMHVPEMKTYYERKVAEGKSKMTVLNAIRNKLLQRIVAVVKRGTPYVDLYSTDYPTDALAV